MSVFNSYFFLNPEAFLFPEMETQNIEFSMEDILNMHRHWITSLYVDDRKTDVEIVGLLHERRLLVTLSQVRLCIRAWGLEVRNVTTISHQPEMLLNEWDWVPSQPSPISPSQLSFTPSDPDMIEFYAKRPLPSIPTSTPIDHDSTAAASTIDRASENHLRVDHHHGQLSSRYYAPEPSPAVSDGPSQLDLCMKDEQNYEVLLPDHETGTSPQAPPYRRAGQSMHDGEGTVRKRSTTRARRIRSDNIMRRRQKLSLKVEDRKMLNRTSSSPER